MFGPARGDGGVQSSQSPFGPSGNRRNLPRSAREQRKANRVSAWGDGSLGKAAHFEALTFDELQVKLVKSGVPLKLAHWGGREPLKCTPMIK